MAQATDLDRKSKLVLEAIYELGGEANTSEIKDYTGIEKNGIISYRYDKLEDAGLIEKHTVDNGETIPISVAELTEKGHDRVGAILDEGVEKTLVERFEELREVAVESHQKVERFEGRLDHVEDRVEEAVQEEELRETQESLRETEEDLQERVDALSEEIWDAKARAESEDWTERHELMRRVETLETRLANVAGDVEKVADEVRDEDDEDDGAPIAEDAPPRPELPEAVFDAIEADGVDREDVHDVAARTPFETFGRGLDDETAQAFHEWREWVRAFTEFPVGATSESDVPSRTVEWGESDE